MRRTTQVLAFLCGALGGLAAAPAQAQTYWRLDLGWSKANDADFKDKKPATDGVICVDPACSTPTKVNDAGDSYVLGGGFGYRFFNLRGEVALSYRGGYGLAGAGSTGAEIKSDITSTAVMANGYYDFQARGVRPYVGLGVGWTQNKMDPVVQTFSGATITSPGGKKSNAASALMAGVGIPLSSGRTLDVGYRYVDLGKFESGSGTWTATGPSGTFTQPYSGAEGKLTAHELAVGIRF
jgi:opacity protein-like surface antigen